MPQHKHLPIKGFSNQGASHITPCVLVAHAQQVDEGAQGGALGLDAVLGAVQEPADPAVHWLLKAVPLDDLEEQAVHAAEGAQAGVAGCQAPVREEHRSGVEDLQQQA